MVAPQLERALVQGAEGGGAGGVSAALAALQLHPVLPQAAASAAAAAVVEVTGVAEVDDALFAEEVRVLERAEQQKGSSLSTQRTAAETRGCALSLIQFQALRCELLARALGLLSQRAAAAPAPAEEECRAVLAAAQAAAQVSFVRLLQGYIASRGIER